MKPSSWQQKLADELYKPIKHNFTRRRVIVNRVDELWCSDLVGDIAIILTVWFL